MLIPKAGRWNDWEDKAFSGYFVGYSSNGTGYNVYIPESNKIMSSSHVLFNEAIPEKSEEYWKELQEAVAVRCA